MDLNKLLVILLSFLAYSFVADGEPELKIKVFKNESGWGYDIYRSDKIYIHQPHIPAISGNQTFHSEEDARRTGELIISKIRKNIIPPTISIAELDSLGILLPIK